MLRHLLQDNDEGVYKVLECAGSFFDLILIVVKRGCHHRRVTIAQRSFHVCIKCFNWLNNIKADENHHGLFPNHLLLMLHKSEDHILHRSYNARMAKFGDNVERCHNFEMIFRL